MKFIIGKKLDMTQVWSGDKIVPVTRIQAGPCRVVQIKSAAKDGYEAVQIGFGEKKEKNIEKPQQGHLKTAGVKSRYLREFCFSQMAANQETNGHKLKIGDAIDVSTFTAGDKVKVSGISKGRGFQGVVKRHHFHGQDKTHGTKDQLRMPGSVGATGPAHIFKGVRMPGRMGGDKVTVANLEIVEVDKENNILSIKGAVPGARNSLVLIQGPGELQTVVGENKVEDNATEKTENSKQTTDEKEIKGQPKDLAYKKLLKSNEGQEESELDKHKILEENDFVKGNKDKCWYKNNLLIFTEEDISDNTLDSIKKSINFYNNQ